MRHLLSKDNNDEHLEQVSGWVRAHGNGMRDYGGMSGWMDLFVGTGVSTALENVQWPKPFLTPAKPLRSGWFIQRIDSSTATTTGATLQYLQYFNSRSRQTAVGPGVRGGCGKVQKKTGV